jgi:2-polyprenyl-3-methyl-5-hydroxy-6-metoxy-1,4-benzoquinol methylase
MERRANKSRRSADMTTKSSLSRCNQCGGAARRTLTARDLNRRVTDETFDYYRCPNCGLIFMDPVPENLGRYYPANYHQIPDSLDTLMRGKPHELFKLDAIGPKGNGRRLLEIGPSYGGFAALAKQAGFDVRAIEMDPDCCRFLQSVADISVVQADDVQAAVRSSGKFDVIALWHSLEHLPDPWTVLDELPAHLAPGGLLAIASPNPLSLQFRLFGRSWVHLDAPRHVSLIPHTVIARRLRRHGMEMLHLSTRDQGAIDCNNLGWVVSPKFKFPGWMLANPYAWIGLRIQGLLRRLEALNPYGAAYTVVFKNATGQ